MRVNEMMKQIAAALILSISVTVLASCAESARNGPVPSPNGSFGVGPSSAREARPSFSYSSLYSFMGGADGTNPEAALMNFGGTLYGTTQAGGGVGCYTFGCGTVFAVTTAGAEQVLYSFQGGTDGKGPIAALTHLNGALYGTTVSGGGSGCYNSTGCGSIFEVSTSGSERVIYSFQGGADGQRPYAPLINVNGTLYGTTGYGGTGACDYIDEKGCGTVFTVSTSGSEHVLYSFKGGKDGIAPSAALIDVKGTLYGTTSGGGANGKGTVFKVTASGVERVLYSFKGGKDGAQPGAALIDVTGALYGTTNRGGGGSACSPGCGTVFTVSTSGAERVLHRFKSGTDGAYPSGLTNVSGTLYGTTTEGGRDGCTYGCGTIFDVSTSGVEHILYSFQGGADGANPNARLIEVNGMLFGTASGGGDSGCNVYGCGTVFEATP